MHRLKTAFFWPTLTLGVVFLACTTRDAAGNPQRGRAEFRRCERCHVEKSKGSGIGPSLQGLFRKHELRRGDKPTARNVRGVIDQGSETMPAHAGLLSEQAQRDLIAYLETL
jgi:mono/diheme cytochrome c family protein